MSLSVYISNNRIHFVLGTGKKKKAKIKQIYSYALPEGCMINGIITDESILTDMLSMVWKKHKFPKKKVRLVIDSTKFNSKRVSMPQVSDRKKVELIQKEYADFNTQEKTLCDYKKLESIPKQHRQILLTTAVEESFIAGYLALFQELGIKVTIIRPAICCAITFLNAMPQLRNRTCVVQILDGNNCASYLFLNGYYRYSSNSRIFSEEGTPEFVTEIGRGISGIIQFHLSEKMEFPLTDVFFAGFQEACITGLADTIANTFHITASVLPENANIKVPDSSFIEADMERSECKLHPYVYAIGNLFTGEC